MNDKGFKIPWNWTLVNWGKSVLIGSFIWPFFWIFLMGENYNGGETTTTDIVFTILSYFIVSSVSVVVGLPAIIPFVLLFVLAGEVLNRRGLTFKQYMLWQQIVFVLIAAATFLTVGHYWLGELLSLKVGLIVSAYTFAGLCVWNKMYVDLYRKNTKTV